MRLFKIRQRRIAVVEKSLRIELDLARRGGKAARCSIGAGFGMLALACLQTHPDALRCGAKLLQRNAGRAELMAVRRVDIAIPELRRETETARQVKDDVRVGPRLAPRSNNGRPILDQ